MASPIMIPQRRRPYGVMTTMIALGAFLVACLAFVAAANDSGPPTVTGAGSLTPAAAVPVDLSEFAITPAKVTAPAGQVSIRASNSGTTAHNLEIVELNQKTLDIQPGANATLDLDDVAAGTYTMICTVPGHADSGMKGTLVVTGSGGAAAAGGSTGAMAGMDHTTGGAVQPKFDNAKMEKDMTAGVSTFLTYAKKYAAGTMKTGNPKLKPTVLADGTKEFHLTAAITDWEVSPGKVVKAWTYNGVVPGPWIRVEPGDKVRIVLKNDLPISTDIHPHGIDLPFDQDGLAPITQDFIEPGATYTYHWTAPAQSQLGMYHAHMHGQVAIVNGLFAVLQVGDVALPAGRTINGIAVPAGLKASDTQEVPVVLNDAGVIGLSLNGKAFPETAPMAAKKGDWLLIHYYNEGLVGHPMHLHRQPQLVVAKDGYPLTEPYRADTVWVGPGERYSVLVRADAIGTWALHCHIVSHAESDAGLTGMVTALVVS